MWIKFIVVFGKEAPKLGKHLEEVQALKQSFHWAPRGVLGSRTELLDLSWEVFSGDPRLAETGVPFNAHPGVQRGRVMSAMVV